jgi:hypothetical protein
VGTSGNSSGTTPPQLRVTTERRHDEYRGLAHKVSSPFPNRFVADIAVSDQSASEAYVTVSGFGTPHVFQTMDFGDHWRNLSGTLPDTPANAVVVETRTSPLTVYVGTDVGVFWASVASSGTPNWGRYQH